jgi:hypothetical protein
VARLTGDLDLAAVVGDRDHEDTAVGLEVDGDMIDPAYLATLVSASETRK